ncbi:MAG TPA: hypothetical protein VFM31_01865, partial [Nitrososphaeraceae archaeon]|nr:hypothetical protein [Nitrososphaeraceae archaeon]
MRKSSSNIYSKSSNRIDKVDSDGLDQVLKFSHSNSLQNNPNKSTSGPLDELVEAKSQLFENIVGYDEIKKIFNYVLNSSLPVHVLLVGPPGSAKTLFLMECMKLPRSYFTLGSHSTKAGMLDHLFNSRPKHLIVDEI